RELVRQGLQHRDFTVRIEAVCSAYHLPPREAQAIYLRSLSDPDDSVKYWALERLERVEALDLTARECLLVASAISSPYYECASEAISVLRRRVPHPPPALRAKIEALANEGQVKPGFRSRLQDLLNAWGPSPAPVV